MENYKSFGEYLRSLRKEKNLTPEEVAEKMKIQPESLKRWERNLEIPTLDDIYKLSEFYMVPCEHILRLKDDLFKPNNKAVSILAKICAVPLYTYLIGWKVLLRYSNNWSVCAYDDCRIICKRKWRNACWSSK